MLWASGVLLVAGSVAAAGWDLWARRIPNALNVSLALVGLASGWLQHGTPGLGDSALGLLVALGLLWVPFHAGWFGGGDVKFAAAVGAFLGWGGALRFVLVGVALGGVVAVVVGLSSPREVRQRIWVNLRLTAMTAEVPQVEKRPDAQRVPLGVALGLAAVGCWFSQVQGAW